MDELAVEAVDEDAGSVADDKLSLVHEMQRVFSAQNVIDFNAGDFEPEVRVEPSRLVTGGEEDGDHHGLESAVDFPAPVELNGVVGPEAEVEGVDEEDEVGELGLGAGELGEEGVLRGTEVVGGDLVGPASDGVVIEADLACVFDDVARGIEDDHGQGL